MTNIGGQVGQGMDVVVQRLANNEFDAILDVRASVAASILAANAKVTTHTGSEPLRLPGLVAQLTLDEHTDCSLQRCPCPPRA